MKSPEFIPLNEEQSEEKDRLEGNDKMHNFVPIEEVLDIVDESTEENEEEEEEHEEYVDHDREQKIQEEAREREYLKRRNEFFGTKKPLPPIEPELHFRQEVGVSSVGPDIIENSNEDIYSVPSELSIEEGDLARISRRKTDEPISSMSPEKSTARNKSHSIVKKGFRDGNTGEDHDNLKTMSDSKKERGLRGIIRNWLGMQNNEETSQHKREHVMEVMDELADDPKNPDLIVTPAHTSAEESVNEDRELVA